MRQNLPGFFKNLAIKQPFRCFRRIPHKRHPNLGTPGPKSMAISFSRSPVWNCRKKDFEKRVLVESTHHDRFFFCILHSPSACSKLRSFTSHEPRHGTYRRHFDSIRRVGLLAGGGQGSDWKRWAFSVNPSPLNSFRCNSLISAMVVGLAERIATAEKTKKRLMFLHEPPPYTLTFDALTKKSSLNLFR